MLVKRAGMGLYRVWWPAVVVAVSLLHCWEYRLAANGFASGSADCDEGATLESSDSVF